jgi:hypothetical protein
VFHMDVEKVDRDVVYVASVSEAWCKRLFKIFHLFHTYVANVLMRMLHICFTHVCCKRITEMFQLFQSLCCKRFDVDVAHMFHTCMLQENY